MPPNELTRHSIAASRSVKKMLPLFPSRLSPVMVAVRILVSSGLNVKVTDAGSLSLPSYLSEDTKTAYDPNASGPGMDKLVSGVVPDCTRAALGPRYETA